MKIVHVGWGHWPEHRLAGPIIYLHKLAQVQMRAGDEVAIVCASERTIPDAPPYAAQTELVEGIPYIHLCNRPVSLHDFWNPLREAHDPDCERAFDAVLPELEPDIVHVHNFVGLSFDVVAAARRHAGAVLSSLHNYIPVCSRDDLFFADSERCGGPRERPCRLCLGTLVPQEDYLTRHATAVDALNACDRVLAVSNRVAEIYEEQGVERDRMAVDRCGTPAGERLWRRLGSRRVAGARAGHEQALGDRPLRLVFFGAGLPRKGAMHLLQGVRELRDPSRVEVNIYGGMGPADQERLNGFLNSAPQAVREAIHFRGGFSQDDLEGILAGADAAVLTPRWEDNGPQTVFEALSAGLPVLGSRVGGIPDVVEDGRNGFLVEESDTRALAAAIERLVDEPGLPAKLRAGIEPPTRMSEHARALRRFYAESLGRPDEQPPPLVLECATVDDVAAAVGTAVADAGRRGTVLVAEDSEAAATLALLHGDVTVQGANGTREELPTAGASFPSRGWIANWPADAEALARALAVATAFAGAIGELEIGVSGDLAEAGEQTLARLAQSGIQDHDLPSVLIRPASADDELPIAELPARLALAGEAARGLEQLWIGDDHGDPLDRVALGWPADGEARHVAVVGEQLDGLRALAASGPLTLVAASPLTRAAAEALGTGGPHPVKVYDRSAGAEPLAAAEAVIVDGRRPEDLGLAGQLGRFGSPAVVVRYAGRLAGPALEAFGLREVARETATDVLATPIPST